MTEPSIPPVTVSTDEEVMARYGIKCVPTDRFHYKSYRFSRLADAVRQAKKDRFED